MNVQPSALWGQCLSLIKENVTGQQFATWFKPIVFESFDAASKTLLVQVPSLFVYEYLEENFVDLMSKMLNRVYGQGVKLTYRVVTDQAHNLTQDIQADPVEKIPTQLPTERGNQSPTILDAAPQDIDPQLDPHKSFSNFIEGNSNKLPRSIGLSIAEHPNTSQFNPMFIYGPFRLWQDSPHKCDRFTNKTAISTETCLVHFGTLVPSTIHRFRIA